MYKATRNTLERKFLLRKEEVRIVLEEYKKKMYNEEFDPGSG